MLQLKEMSKEDIITAAEKRYKNKDFELALPLFKEMWETYGINDPYTLFKYGNVLRKNNLSLNYIEIYEEYDFSSATAIQKNYADRILSWCLYDTFIKKFDSEKDNYDNFISNAQRILEIQKVNNHDGYSSSFIKTCLKVAKEVAKHTVIPNYKEVIYWVELLDVNQLSDEPFAFKDSDNNDREKASDKEYYYQYLSKCYEKVNDYSKCYEICQKAIEDIGKFHYRNHIWIKERKLYVSCFIDSNYESAIKEYTSFAEKQNKCFIFHKLANLNFMHGKISESILYGSKALLLEKEIPKIINLIEDLAYYWRENGNDQNAKKFFYMCIYHRLKRGWKISQELEYERKQYSFSFSEPPDFDELVIIATQFINKTSYTKIKSGKIISINHQKKFGFIKQDNEPENIHFSFKNVIDRNALQKDRRVNYEIIIDNRKMKEAINLRGE